MDQPVLPKTQKEKIYQEYELLCRASKASIDESATDPLHVHKNRYIDVLPTKETAIKLHPLEGNQDSTYINANFVSDRNKRQSYICCQAPLAATMGDFWRMIWQQEVSLIVMITKLRERERTKADRYWPMFPGVSEYYDGVRVNFIKEHTLPGSSLTIRTFYILQETNSPTRNQSIDDCSNSGSFADSDRDSEGGSTPCISGEIPDSDYTSTSSESSGEMPPNMRKVIQLHCTDWPDQGIPKSTDSMKELLSEVDIRRGLNRKPICVHCSAGIGRTGTFVAIRICLDQWLSGEPVNIYDTVQHLRDQRTGSVQTKHQYYFIHRAVERIITQRTQKQRHLPRNDPDFPVESINKTKRTFSLAQPMVRPFIFTDKPARRLTTYKPRDRDTK